MGYLIKNVDVGETDFFIPTFSEFSANIVDMVYQEPGFYYLFPAKIGANIFPASDSKLLMYSFNANTQTSASGNFTFAVNLPNNYIALNATNIYPVVCNAYSVNANILHIGYSNNINGNKINITVHCNTIIIDVLVYQIFLYVN